jgi:RNA polymerase-binding transcription factor DksA
MGSQTKVRPQTRMPAAGKAAKKPERAGQAGSPSQHSRTAGRPRHGHTAGTLVGRDGREFRALLEAERLRLTAELAALERRAALIEDAPWTGGEGGDDDAMVDAAINQIERDRNSAVVENLRDLLTEIEHALARLRQGTYGICLGCGRPIHPRRLRAIPYATLCIACKEHEERARQAFGPATFREWRVLKTPKDWDEDEAAPGPEGRRGRIRGQVDA